MHNYSYLKIILTLIALELLVLILKPSNVYINERTPVGKAEAIQTGQNMGEIKREPEQQVLSVKIVDIQLPSRVIMPVIPYNNYDGNRHIPLKVEVVK